MKIKFQIWRSSFTFINHLTMIYIHFQRVQNIKHSSDSKNRRNQLVFPRQPGRIARLDYRLTINLDPPGVRGLAVCPLPIVSLWPHHRFPLVGNVMWPINWIANEIKEDSCSNHRCLRTISPLLDKFTCIVLFIVFLSLSLSLIFKRQAISSNFDRNSFNLYEIKQLSFSFASSNFNITYKIQEIY